MLRSRHILSLAYLAFVTIALLIVFPVTARAEETKIGSSAPHDQGIPDELKLLKEEETVSIASSYEQPISHAPSNVYVIQRTSLGRSHRQPRHGLADGAILV